jgi:hypothetical protein
MSDWLDLVLARVFLFPEKRLHFTLHGFLRLAAMMVISLNYEIV